MPKKYDLLVIGGGSGGLAHAQRAAEYGASVAIIEQALIGGTCVNVGCVPKKVMWYAANYANQIKYASDYGFEVPSKDHNWIEFKTKRDAYIGRLNNIYETNLNNRGIEYIVGQAKFIDANNVKVNDKIFQSEHIVIATGGQPAMPDIPGVNFGINSDDFFALDDKPDSVLIIGSGYIAVELACVLNSLGTETSILVRKQTVLRNFDQILSNELLKSMKKDGIIIETGVIPKSVTSNDKGLILTAEDGRKFGPNHSILWAIGRTPNTASLDLHKAGIKKNKFGFIETDKMQSTNIKNIFALGDVTGRAALTPVAIAAGRRLADRLFGGMVDRYLDYSLIPTVIFSHPTIGTVGMTENEARKKYGDDIKVYTSKFTPMFYALSEDKKSSSMKLITAGKDDHIVGLHIFGHGADEMLQGFAVAIQMGATKKDFDDTLAIHPSNAEEIVTMR